LTDTVGFIHKLPPLIVAAFHATLEELDEADLLLHVVDITSPEAVNQSRTVETILHKLKLDEKPRITVINKMDQMVESHEEAQNICFEVQSAPESTIAVSALKGWNLSDLIAMMGEFLAGQAGEGGQEY